MLRVENIHSEEIKYTLQKINEIKSGNYIPLILFLCNNLDRTELTLDFIKNNLTYEGIEKYMIYFEQYEDQLFLKNLLKIILKF